eukprot:g50143.t1
MLLDVEPTDVRRPYLRLERDFVAGVISRAPEDTRTVRADLWWAREAPTVLRPADDQPRRLILQASTLIGTVTRVCPTDSASPSPKWTDLASAQVTFLARTNAERAERSIIYGPGRRWKVTMQRVVTQPPIPTEEEIRLMAIEEDNEEAKRRTARHTQQDAQSTYRSEPAAGAMDHLPAWRSHAAHRVGRGGIGTHSSGTTPPLKVYTDANHIPDDVTWEGI